MTSTSRLTLGLLVLAVGVLAWPADLAKAEPMGLGDVYGVFATDGDFANDLDPNQAGYTVVHFATFEWSEVFNPESGRTDLQLSPLPFAAPTLQDLGFAEGAQYFLLGSLSGPDEFGVFDDHLLVSAASADGQPPVFENPFGVDLHDDLIRGAQQTPLLLAGAPLLDTDATTFWGDYVPGTREHFFGFGSPGMGFDPILNLSAITEDGGSEDLFGYGDLDYALHSTICDCYDDPITYNGDLTGRLNGLVVGGKAPVSFTPANDKILPAPVPEPATLTLLGGALAFGLGIRRRRRAA